MKQTLSDDDVEVVLLLIIVSITTSECNGGFEEHFLLHRNDIHLKNSSYLTKHLKFSVLMILIAYGKVIEGGCHVKLKEGKGKNAVTRRWDDSFD